MFPWTLWSALWLWRSVTDFSSWDAHEARLRRPDDVSGDIWRWNARGVLSLLRLNLPTTQTMVTTGILPQRENSHGRTGNRTRDLMISSQRLWPLDHEAGQFLIVYLNISQGLAVRHLSWATSHVKYFKRRINRSLENHQRTENEEGDGSGKFGLFLRLSTRSCWWP
jgi:hypothetical protein